MKALILVSAVDEACVYLNGCHEQVPMALPSLPTTAIVQSFRLLTESCAAGSKKWRVYAPLDIELPEESSPDLPHEVIGKPILEVTLNVGDVLYLPRGTIHEAEAQEETSSHLTLSTYQKWNWHELAERVIEVRLCSSLRVTVN